MSTVAEFRVLTAGSLVFSTTKNCSLFSTTESSRIGIEVQSMEGVEETVTASTVVV